MKQDWSAALKLTQLAMLRWVAAQQKRSVWPMIQLVIKPP